LNILSSLLFTAATWLLILVPFLIFGASCLIWKIRGGRNIIRDFAIHDAIEAFIITVGVVLAALPFALWPGNVAVGIVGFFPLIYAGWAYRHFDQGRYIKKVIAYFRLLRDEKRLAAPSETPAG
jgi:hypothetical protein